MADEIARGAVGLAIDKASFLRDVDAAAGEGAAGLASKFKSVLGAGGGLGALIGVGAAVGATFLDIGEKFESSFHTIQERTGATGTALKSLDEDFKAVFASTPGANFQNVADAISEVSVRTGLAGKPLEDLTAKFVELGKVTKTDVAGDVQQATALLNLFGVSAGNQSKQLDVLFKASQDAGVSIGDFMGQLQAAAPTAQALGLNVDQTAAIVDKLTRLGLPATKVMMGLGMEFGKAAKAGKDPTQVIGQMVAAIQKAPTPTAAMTAAMKDFGIGARQASTLVDAVRSGVFNFGQTLGQITSGKGGITDTANATLTLGDRFRLLKNDVLTSMEPIAEKVLGVADSIVSQLPKAFDAVKSWAGDVAGAFDKGGLAGVARLVGHQVADIATAIGNAVAEWAPKIAAKVAQWASDFWGWVEKVWPKLGPALGHLYDSVTNWLSSNVPKLGDWADAFAGWVSDGWDRMSHALGDKNGLLDKLTTWITANAPTVAKALGAWSDAFGGWVGDVWPKVVKELDKLWKDVSHWIASTVPKAADDFSKWLDSLGTWFEQNAGPWMEKHFSKWGEALGQWLGQHTPELVAKFDYFATALGLWVTLKFIPSLVESLGEGLIKFTAELTVGLAKGAMGAIGGFSKGLADGVIAMFGDVANAVGDIFIGPINKVVGYLDDLIHTFNKIPFAPNLPDIPKIPPAPSSSGAAVAKGGLASGTDNWPGGLAWVGEQGPELLNIPRGGQVLDHGTSISLLHRAVSSIGVGAAVGGGGTNPLENPTINITTTTPADQLSAGDIARRMRAAHFLLGR